MKHYVIDEQTLQEVANYITNNPSGNMPVGVAISIIGKLQGLKELAVVEQPPADPPDPSKNPNGGAHPQA